MLSFIDLTPKRAQEQGASNATFGPSIGHCSTKLHVYEVCRACGYSEVVRESFEMRSSGNDVPLDS